MSDKLQRVGLVFKADGSVDFNKSLKEVTASIQENRTAFELVKSTWDDSTKTAEKLKETQKYLSEQTKDYSDKVTLLSRQLDELEAAENRDERAIQNKRNQLNQAKTSLNNYKKGLDEVEDKLKSGSARMNDYAKKLRPQYLPLRNTEKSWDRWKCQVNCQDTAQRKPSGFIRHCSAFLGMTRQQRLQRQICRQWGFPNSNLPNW